jgi:hypothetical protein
MRILHIHIKLNYDDNEMIEILMSSPTDLAASRHGAPSTPYMGEVFSMLGCFSLFRPLWTISVFSTTF